MGSTSAMLQRRKGERYSGAPGDKASSAELSQPRTCEPSIVLPLAMFLCGVGNAVPDAALQVYTLSVLLVSPATQGALFGALMRLPWQFKIAVAFLSDAVPLCGRRRLPYLMLALTAKAALMATIAMQLPTVKPLAALVFASVVCQLFIGVALDTIVVEQMARDDLGAKFGQLQTHCWIGLTLGSLMGQLLGMYMLGGGATGPASRPLVSACFATGAGVQLLNLALVTMLPDPRVGVGSATLAMGRGGCCAHSRRLLGEVGGAMRRKAIWWPCLFLFLQACHLRNTAAFDAFLLGHPRTSGSGDGSGGGRRCSSHLVDVGVVYPVDEADGGRLVRVGVRQLDVHLPDAALIGACESGIRG